MKNLIQFSHKIVFYLNSCHSEYVIVWSRTWSALESQLIWASQLSLYIHLFKWTLGARWLVQKKKKKIEIDAASRQRLITDATYATIIIGIWGRYTSVIGSSPLDTIQVRSIVAAL